MKTEDLLKRYEEMLKSGSGVFFDADEFEIIIDSYLVGNQYAMALNAVDSALSQYPFSIDFLIQKAQLLSTNKETRKAMEVLNQAQGLDPIHPEIFMTKGSIFSLTGLSEKAIENFNKAIEYAGDAKDIVEDGYLYLAFEYENLEQFDNAIFCLKKVVGFNPKNDSALFEIAFCYEMSNKDHEAIDFFNEFLDKNPYSDSIWFNLGIVYNRLNMFEKAIAAYDYTIAIKEDFAPAYFNKANSLANQNQLKEAITCYEQTFKYEKPEAITYCYIAECYEKLKRHDLAISNYNRAISIDSTLADAWIGMGIVMDQQDKLTEGIHYLKKGVDLEKTNAEYLYVIAEAYQKLGFMDEAANAFGKVVELDPALGNIWLDYSNLLFEMGEKEKTLEIISEGIKHQPDNADLFYRMAACLLWLGKKKEALNYLQSALQLDYKKHKEIFRFLPELKKNRTVLDMIKSFKK